MHNYDAQQHRAGQIISPLTLQTITTAQMLSVGGEGASDVWHEQPLNEVVEAFAANILFQFLSLLHHGTSLHNTISTCLRFVQVQSNFRQSLTGYIVDVAVTFKSFI